MVALAQRANVAKLHRAGHEWKACCPFHLDKSPSFSIYAGDRRWRCWSGCGDGDQLDFVQRQYRVDLVEAIRMIDSGALPIVLRQPCNETDHLDAKIAKIEDARRIWRGAVAIGGTHAEAYLRARGITMRLPESLRFTWLRYGSTGERYPVLVALVASVDHHLCGIQRTYLDPRGPRKAHVPKPKLSLGRIRGGAIRLAPAATYLTICEGLEDGLTLQQEQGRAVWVAAGAGMLPAMRLPDGCTAVVVGADADEAGETSALKAVAVQRECGRVAKIIRPLSPHKDFNAELMSGAA